MEKNLLKILCCPSCQNKLKQKENKLICQKCKKEYQIKDNIAILLPKQP